MNLLINDYLKHVKNLIPEKVILVEDSLILNEEDGTTESVNSLFEVYTEDAKEYYIQVASNHSNTVFEADAATLRTFFPEFYQELFGGDHQERPTGFDSKLAEPFGDGVFPEQDNTNTDGTDPSGSRGNKGTHNQDNGTTETD